ncbi:MAG: hypothetical protein HY074_00260 [Deltaproteobacteria bacterium]|nr:hypothetical protein [Deltaproteobacteria bacterium]
MESGLLIQLIEKFSKRRGERSFGEKLKALQELGFFQAALCEQGISALCLVLQELAAFDAALAVALFSHWAAAQALRLARFDFNSESPLAFPAFRNISETQDLQTNDRDGRCIITGKVESVLLTGQATHAVIANFLVPLTGGTVTLSAPVRTLGIRSCPHVDISMSQTSGVRFASDELFDQLHDRMALPAAAIALGISRSSLDEAVLYAKTRKQGGKEIIKWSEVWMLLSQMTMQFRTGAAALSRVCAQADAGEAGWERDAAATAVCLQELACALTSDGIQILGGAGYTTEFGQEKRFRDAFHTQHLLGLLPSRKRRFAARFI